MSEVKFDTLQKSLSAQKHVWCVTGGAGFIGSHLTEILLRLGQSVRVIDNFATGSKENLEDVRSKVSDEEWDLFQLFEGDITDLTVCEEACRGVDFVLHQAALGSVPRSVRNPLASHRANVDGFLNMLLAARDSRAKRFVYASSSSVYGDDPSLPKVEERTGSVLSPYAATKAVNEVYAGVFQRVYGMQCLGLRYFNVFGPRQDPLGAYAAVIPRWIGELLRGEQPVIYGDGETSRDFCFIDNVVQANLLAATAEIPRDAPSVFNVACGAKTSLKELFHFISRFVSEVSGKEVATAACFREFREGDVRHSLADISRARAVLGYEPTVQVADGLDTTVRWFCP